LALDGVGPVETGFRLGWYHLNPLVRVEVTWEKPEGVDVELARRGTSLVETVTGSLRGLEQEIVRWVRVVDVLGVAAITYRQRLARPVRIAPDIGQVKGHLLLQQILPGDAVSHP